VYLQKKKLAFLTINIVDLHNYDPTSRGQRGLCLSPGPHKSIGLFCSLFISIQNPIM